MVVLRMPVGIAILAEQRIAVLVVVLVVYSTALTKSSIRHATLPATSNKEGTTVK
jgi:hypothetical protein